MKSVKWARLLMAAAALILLAAPMRAQKPDQQSEQDKQMQAAMQAAQPGAVHQKLAKRVGEWTIATKVWMQPGAPPSESTGTAKITSILGGRFLREEGSGTFMGQPSSGMRLWGYNNGTKQYEAMWMYTGSTAMLMLKGTSSDDGKTVGYTGAVEDAQKVTLRVEARQI